MLKALYRLWLWSTLLLGVNAFFRGTRSLSASKFLPENLPLSSPPQFQKYSSVPVDSRDTAMPLINKGISDASLSRGYPFSHKSEIFSNRIMRQFEMSGIEKKDISKYFSEAKKDFLKALKNHEGTPQRAALLKKVAESFRNVFRLYKSRPVGSALGDIFLAFFWHVFLHEHDDLLLNAVYLLDDFNPDLETQKNRKDRLMRETVFNRWKIFSGEDALFAYRKMSFFIERSLGSLEQQVAIIRSLLLEKKQVARAKIIYLDEKFSLENNIKILDFFVEITRLGLSDDDWDCEDYLRKIDRIDRSLHKLLAQEASSEIDQESPIPKLSK